MQSTQRRREFHGKDYGKDYVATQGQTAPWFIFLFLAFLFNLQKRQLVTSCWHYDGAHRPGSNTLQFTNPAADCSPLQSSQTCKACVVMCPVIAQMPNWGCAPNGAFRAKVTKAFPVSKQMALPQCCFKNTVLFWVRWSWSWSSQHH